MPKSAKNLISAHFYSKKKMCSELKKKLANIHHIQTFHLFGGGILGWFRTPGGEGAWIHPIRVGMLLLNDGHRLPSG